MAVAGPVTGASPHGGPSGHDDGPPSVSYRFARSPRWLVLHVVAVALLAGMITAGLWQLSRLRERQALNRLLDARTTEEPVELTSVLGPADTPADADALLYRPVTATGRYLADHEVFVRSRSLDGNPGAWVLTPLEVGDGAVIVNRGWIPAATTNPTLPEGAAPPTGTVTVEGLLVAGQTRGRIGARDPVEGVLRVLARADLDRLQAQVPADLFPAIVQRVDAGASAAGTLPVPLPEPDRDEGPHRGYAGQWFIFAALWVVGYPLLVRRAARRRLAGGRTG